MLIRLLLPAFLCLFSLLSHGQSLEWAKKIGGSSNETGYKTAVDVNGNVYVTGNIVSANIDFDPSAAVYNLSSAGGKDGFVAKYDQYGNFKWAFRFGGSDHDDVNDITTDHAGNIVIVGYFRGSGVDFNPAAAVNALNSNGQAGGDPGYGGDMFVAKYDTLGNYKWAFNVGGTALGDNGIGISVDNSNNVLLTGYMHSASADFDPSPTGTAILSNSNGPLFVAKYNDLGQYQWAFSTGGVGVDNSGFDIVSDQLGNVIVTGYFQGSSIDFNPSPTASNTLSSGGGFDFFLAKYSPSGQYLWAFRAGGSGQDVGRAVITDANNDIYLTGDFSSASIDLDPGPFGYLLTLNGSNDAFIAKYSSSGEHLWSFDLGGNSPIGDLAWNMAKDAASNIFITGRFAGSNVDFDPSVSTTLLSSSGDADAYVAKYTPDGQFICAFKMGGTGYDIGHGIGSYGNYVYVTGNFAGAPDFDPGAGSTVLTSSGGDDAFFAKYNWSASPLSGTITGGIFCPGQQAFMTFNATGGTGPYSITISDGTHFFTYNNIVSGVPFPLTYSPLESTTYTLTSIKDASPCSGNVAVSSTAVISTACGPEDCNNGIDDDGDGLTDCADPDCIGCSTPCGPVPRVSGKIFNTATNGAGGVLPLGSMDRHWTWSYTLGGVPHNAFFSTGCNPPGWTSPYPDAEWITPGQVTICGFTPQVDSAHTYFSTSFQVPASLVPSLKLALDVSADNYIGEVYLNGVPQGIRHTSSDLFCPGCKISFTLNGGFVAGKNTLTILVLQQPTTTPVNAQSIGLLVNAKVIMDSDNDGVTDDLDLCPGTPPGVTVNATGCFDIDITANSPICRGDSLVLESSFAGTGSIYQWTTPAGQVLTGKRIVIQNITAAHAGRYYLDITDAYNCIRKDSIDITPAQPPVVTVNPDVAACANTPVQLTASGGGTYRWFPATGLSDPNIANPIATVSAATTYKVVVTGASGCKDSAMTTISIKEAPVMVSAGGGAICRGDSVQLGVSGGVSYQWFPSTGLSNANVGNPKASPATNTTYKVVVTAASGCKDSLNVTVTVNDLPTVTVSANAAVCPGDSAQLNAGGGASYEWSPAAGLSNAFTANPKASPAAPTTYTVTAISAMGCRSTATTTVSLHPKPTAVVVHPAGICTGDSAQLDASGGVSYQWIPAVGLSNANIANPKASPSTTTPYEVIVFNAQGCRDTAATLVSVKPLPVLSLGKDTTICPGGTASFDATLLQAASYLWSDGSTGPVLTTSVPGKYFVDVFISSCGKPVTDTVLVAVAQLPQVFLGEDTAACLLTPVTIRANGSGITDYLWSTGSRESFIVVNAEGIYTVTATNSCGTDSDDITVKMLPCSDDLYFPSAFTPNGNGRNDQFRPGYFSGTGITGYELRIYNRWGELVFVSTNLDKGWDGTYKGKLQQNSVFVWYAKYKKTTGKNVIQKKGTVVLIK